VTPDAVIRALGTHVAVASPELRLITASVSLDHIVGNAGRVTAENLLVIRYGEPLKPGGYDAVAATALPIDTGPVLGTGSVLHAGGVGDGDGLIIEHDDERHAVRHEAAASLHVGNSLAHPNRGPGAADRRAASGFQLTVGELPVEGEGSRSGLVLLREVDLDLVRQGSQRYAEGFHCSDVPWGISIFLIHNQLDLICYLFVLAAH
jgi:hypothetical protein